MGGVGGRRRKERRKGRKLNMLFHILVELSNVSSSGDLKNTQKRSLHEKGHHLPGRE